MSGRGSYARRFTESNKWADVDRARDWETNEYSTARKVGLACDKFFKEREITKPKKADDTRNRPRHKH